MRASLAVLAALCAALLLPGAAGAVPFGANLNRPANVNFDCTIIPAGFFAYPSNAQTCTWFSAGTASNSAETFNVPAGYGTVTQARVRVGSVTGPMRIVVLSTLRDPNQAIQIATKCCKAVNQTAVFTPAPNAVTTVNVRLPVRNDPAPVQPSKLLEFNTLALSVLAPGVPIPAHDTGIGDPLAAPISAAFFPDIRPPQERVDAAGTSGYQVLLQGEWVPGQAAGGPGGVISLIQPVASVRNGRAVLSLNCNQARPCAGFLRLQGAAAAGAAAGVLPPEAPQRLRGHIAKAKTYGSAHFSIKARKSKKVKARLTSAGRKLLRKKKRRVWVNIKINGKTYATGQATLKR